MFPKIKLSSRRGVNGTSRTGNSRSGVGLKRRGAKNKISFKKPGLEIARPFQTMSKEAKHRLKVLRACHRRKFCLRLRHVFSLMYGEDILDSSPLDTMDYSFGGISLSFLLYSLRKASVQLNVVRSRMVRNFVLSMYCLSRKTYSYLQPVYHLPRPVRLRRWRETTQGRPGVQREALQHLRRQIRAGKQEPLCSLIISTVPLVQGVGTWSGEHGGRLSKVDLGGGWLRNTEASHALVIMLVGLDGHWKTMMAYFLVDDSCSGPLTQVVEECLLHTADYNLQVRTLVFNDLELMVKVSEELGCIISTLNSRMFFQHPHRRFHYKKVYCLWDLQRALDAVLNFVAHRSHVVIKKSGQVSWKYVSALHCALESEESGPSLSSQPGDVSEEEEEMAWSTGPPPEQINLSQASQDIDRLRDDLNYSEFSDSEATSQFLRYMGMLDRLLTNRKCQAMPLKAALSDFNGATFTSVLALLQSCLATMRFPDDVHVSSRPLGRSVLVLFLSISAVIGLSVEWVSSRLSSLMLCKLSARSVRSLVSQMRPAGTYGEKLTAAQVVSAARKLGAQHYPQPCRHGDTNSILSENCLEESLCMASHAACIDLDHLNVVGEGEAEAKLREAARILHATLSLRDAEWEPECLLHTALFICSHLGKIVQCRLCRTALMSAEKCLCGRYSRATMKSVRDYGLPSSSVLNIMWAAEKSLSKMDPVCAPSVRAGKPRAKRSLLQVYLEAQDLLQSGRFCLFPSLSEHFFDHETGYEDDHCSQLVRAVVTVYARLRVLGRCADRQRRLNSLLLG